MEREPKPLLYKDPKSWPSKHIRVAYVFTWPLSWFLLIFLRVGLEIYLMFSILLYGIFLGIIEMLMAPIMLYKKARDIISGTP